MAEHFASPLFDAAPLHLGDVMLGLGDSITAGIGAGHVDEGCMRLLAGRLRRLHPDLELAHLAIPSESSASMLAPGGQLERAEVAIASAVQQGRSVGPVAMSVGGNDVMEAALIGDDAALQQLEENLALILRRLDAALRPGGQRLAECCAVQTLYNPFEALPADDCDLMAPRRAARGGFNAAIRRAAQNVGVRIVDVAGLFRGRSLELTWVRTGDMHPTAEGHQLIAEEYLRVGGWSLPVSDAAASLPGIDPVQFFAADIRVGRVLRCEPFPEARKPAYRLLIDFGPLGEKRSAARLTDLYAPGDLEGSLVCAVVNFPPRQVGPVRSEVLVLGAYVQGGEVVGLLRPDGDVQPGDRIG